MVRQYHALAGVRRSDGFMAVQRMRSGRASAIPGPGARHMAAGTTWERHHGNEGDGNPPGLGPGHTRFDSEVPDRGREDSPPAPYRSGGLRAEPMSLPVHHGAVAQLAERPSEKREAGVSESPGPTTA